MKNEIRIDGILYRKAEEAEIKAGEWWYHSTGSVNLILEVTDDHGGTVKCMPTYGDGKNASFHGVSTMTDRVDIKEVERLLISQAEKKGYKKGVSVNGTYITNRLIRSEEFSIEDSGLYMDDFLIFNSETGRWVEIIEEKRPPYNNIFGTKFFDGDEFWWVGQKGEITMGDSFDDQCHTNKACLFIGTWRECHKWIYDNWK